MAAHVVKSSQHTVVTSEDDDVLIDDPSRDVVAPLGQVAHMTLVPPAAIEDRLVFQAPDGRIPVPVRRQRRGLLGPCDETAGIEIGCQGLRHAP